MWLTYAFPAVAEGYVKHGGDNSMYMLLFLIYRYLSCVISEWNESVRVWLNVYIMLTWLLYQQSC